MRRAAIIARGVAAWRSRRGLRGLRRSAKSGANEPLTRQQWAVLRGQLPLRPGRARITSTAGIRSTIIPAGTVAKSISGNAAEGALSVAVALDGLSSGYWVTPVGPPDQDTKGELTWKVICNFAHDLPAGPQKLRFAAANRDGTFGAQRLLDVTTTPFVPEGNVVASLSWGNDADVDLHLISPSGKELDPKHISTTEIDEDTKLPLPGGGTLDRDSIANCVPDGRRRRTWSGRATRPSLPRPAPTR